MLFWALLLSGQITTGKVDGWQRLATKPSDPVIDLAAQPVDLKPLEAAPPVNIIRDGTVTAECGSHLPRREGLPRLDVKARNVVHSGQHETAMLFAGHEYCID
jgi:hypothetical protein